jgi:hypothetical protein
MRKPAVLALAGVATLLAACGSAAKPPPSAAALAHKIPGTYSCGSQQPSVLATADVQCLVRDGGGVIELATFASSGDEVKWIEQNAFYGCCVQGTGWAADYTFSAGSSGFSLITKAIGGRVVSG